MNECIAYLDSEGAWHPVPYEELIRCKDCIYWKRYCRIVDGVTSNHVCGRKRELDGLMHRSKADDFCSWAKRRNDETD